MKKSNWLREILITIFGYGVGRVALLDSDYKRFEQKITSHFKKEYDKRINTKTLQRLCSDLGVDLFKGMVIADHGRKEERFDCEECKTRLKKEYAKRLLSEPEILKIMCEEKDCMYCPKIAKAISDEMKRRMEL